jgi:hypothetical protein
MDEDDDAELGVLLGSLSENAARIASEALAGASATTPPARPSIGGDLDWLVRAIADALRRRSGRRPNSANQIAAAVARAVQRGARFT